LGNLGRTVGYVIVLRHPWEVACALRERENCALPRGHLRWLTQYREALAAGRNRPCAIVTHDQLLADPAATLMTLGERLGLIYPQPLAERYPALLDWVRPERKHYHAGSAADAGVDPDRFAPFAAFYQGLRLQAQTAPDLLEGEGTGSESLVPIFQECLTLIGDYERTEREVAWQKERLTLLDSRPDEVLYARVATPTAGDATASTEPLLLPPGEWRPLRIPVAQPLALRERSLEIAPLNARGLVTISALRLLHAATGQVCWQLAPADFGRCALENALRLPDETEALTLLIYDRNARLCLPALPELPDSPLELEIWIKASASQAAMVEVWAGEQRRQQRLATALDEAARREAELRQALTDAQGREAELQDALENAAIVARERQAAYEEELHAQSQALAAAAQREAELQRIHEQERHAQSQALAAAAQREAELQRTLGAGRERERSLDQALAAARNQVAVLTRNGEETRRQLAEHTHRLVAETGRFARVEALQRELVDIWRTAAERYATGYAALETDCTAIAQSTRWRLGHRLLRPLEWLLLRGRPRLAIDNMRETLASARYWRPHPPLSAEDWVQARAQLRDGLRQLELDFQSLRASLRWRLGCAMMRVVEIALFKFRAPRLAMDDVQEVFAAIHAWPDTERPDQDVSQLSQWLEQVRQDYLAMVGSRRWRVGHFLCGLLDLALFRGRPRMATDNMRETLAWLDRQPWLQPGPVLPVVEDIPPIVLDPAPLPGPDIGSSWSSATEQELREENDLLLLQLHQVQEELEHYFLEYQALKQRVAAD
jgi:hypothetical protein